MTAYYNEIDPFCAQWLRNLIAAGHLPPGDVDERDIREVQDDDVRGYREVHFFAGIGGWPYALRLAGWPSDRPVWTGSCPCQPLSSAGRRQGHADERHLWPAFHRLIAECRPATVLGEQVASKDGREWFAGVRADLEALGYACGAADLCAAGVGAPHIRQRLFWVADAYDAGQRAGCRSVRDQWHDAGGRGASARMADSECIGREDAMLQRTSGGTTERQSQQASHARTAMPIARMGDSASPRRQGERGVDRASGARDSGQSRPAMQDDIPQWNGATVCVERADGPVRIPAEPALFPVASRLPGDVGRLRGAGNAIVPQVAAEFVAALMECRP